MKCYIYKIINLITNEKYVGQTTNYNRRKENHLSALHNNRHPNPKLQNSWNYYGEENFVWEVKTYDLTKSELDQLEINTIKQENSYSNGFNLTKNKEIYNSLTDSEIYNRAELVYNKYNIQGQLAYKLADKKNIIRVNCAL